jgi:hypothetical protein
MAVCRAVATVTGPGDNGVTPGGDDRQGMRMTSTGTRRVIRLTLAGRVEGEPGAPRA